jgi:hypothetical protein
MVYRRLPDQLARPGPFIGELRRCREAVIRVSATVKPFGAVYCALHNVTAAIDAAAALISGRRDYFHEPGGGATEGQKLALDRQRAFERGEGDL